MPCTLRGGTMTFWQNWGTVPPDLLLVHCTLAHSGAWNGFAKQLNRPAVAFDMPGHGRSDDWDNSLDYLDQCLGVAADFLGQTQMDVIGHSFGAVVGLRLALERPEQVRRLILMEPVLFAAACGTREYNAHVAGFRPLAEAFAAGDYQLAAQIFTSVWGANWRGLSKEQQQAIVSRIHLIPAQDGALLADNADLLRPGRLEELEIPVLLLEGSESPEVIQAINRALETRLPNAARGIMPNAGHMLPLTHPVETAAAAESFLHGLACQPS